MNTTPHSLQFLRAGHSLGDVIINLILQLLVIFLLKYIVDSYGMQVTVCAPFAYVVVIAVCQFFLTTYYNRNRVTEANDEMKHSWKDKHWRMVVTMILLVYISLSVKYASVCFYFQDYVDQQALAACLNRWGMELERDEAYKVGLTSFIVVGMISQIGGGVIFEPFYNKAHVKKGLFSICMALTALFSMLFYLAQPDDIGLMFVLFMLTSLIYAPTAPLLWGIVGSVADHVEFSTKRRVTFFIFSITTFALNAGLALGVAFAGITLWASGYVSETDTLQSWSAVQGIRWVCSVLPTIFIVAVLAIHFHASLRRRT